MIVKFEPRLYQKAILETASIKNTLVILPTGMGKTGIAMLLADKRLSLYPQSKTLFLAPTKPLAEQHLKTFKKHLSIPEDKVELFTGEISPEKRAELWQKKQMIFSTPQGLENDIISKRISLKDVSLLVFDEAHRAVGDYSYVFISKEYNKQADFPKILALTASPGSELSKIEEVCDNLFIEEVEIRTEDDKDVKPYVQEILIDWIKLELPESFKQIRALLDMCLKSKLRDLKKYGAAITDYHLNFSSKKELLRLQKAVHFKLSRGEKNFTVLKSASILAEAMKVHHALELLESQGISSLYAYMKKIFDEAEKTKVKAVKNLVKDAYFKTSYYKTTVLFENGTEHPKVEEVKKIIMEELDADKFMKIILFTQYRSSAVKLKEELNGVENVNAEIFVGQAKKEGTGLSQKQQIKLLDNFRDGFFNVLIATSVAEEGLDIPSVDLVIFYEPIPSAIRHIQRRGRTGRHEKGRVIVLMAKQTRDEGYKWSAYRKEKIMKYNITKLKGKLSRKLAKNQRTITDYKNESIRIFAGYREKSSSALKELHEMNVDVKLEKLSADYILSSRVGVEVKKVADFVNSIVDGRLLNQLKSLRENFSRPLVVIEGEEDIFSIRQVHPNAIRGMVATIAVSYGIPLIYTKNQKETAEMLLAIAKREQEINDKEFSKHEDKKVMSLKEQQEYVISALPYVGPKLAKELLKNLKSVKEIVNSNVDDLKKVGGVGDKIAKGIKEVIEKNYED